MVTKKQYKNLFDFLLKVLQAKGTFSHPIEIKTFSKALMKGIISTPEDNGSNFDSAGEYISLEKAMGLEDVIVLTFSTEPKAKNFEKGLVFEIDFINELLDSSCFSTLSSLTLGEGKITRNFHQFGNTYYHEEYEKRLNVIDGEEDIYFGIKNCIFSN